MCGIAGIALPQGGRPDRERLQRMAARMSHRGPDEEGFLVREGVGFAFRRLRIIDLTSGSQPQTNEDGTVHVIFNGEIYNHQELRERLLSKGHRFTTASDTEALVHLYEEKGPDLVFDLNGMFAFAIWDSRTRTLLLARDHVGIKPLLWAETEGGLAFGSEMGCFLEVPGIDRSIDPVALHEYLSWGAIPAPRTIFCGVNRLPPAHLLLWQNGRSSIRRYWDPLTEEALVPANFEEGKRRLRELLEDSVRRQMISDVPLGAFLSGGVDSTTLVGLMAHQTSGVHTFSIAFSENPIFDESEYAREAAAYHHTHHQEDDLHAEDLCEMIPAVLDRLEEPFGSSSLLPAYAVSRQARRRMTVALSGDGADELFGGYNKYLGEAYRALWERIPRVVREGVLGPAIRRLPASRGTQFAELGRKAHRFLDGLEGDPAERHDRWMRIASASEVGRLLGAPDGTNPGLEIIRALHTDFDNRRGADPLNRTLFTDFSLALPSDMLLKVDIASMLNSLEVRVPFLDHRIASLAMSMPSSWKMRGTERKRVLKAAAHDLLPSAIRNRPKAGFDVPVGEWLKTTLRELFWDTVSSKGSISLDETLLGRWYEDHRSGRADRSKILWAVFALRWWEGRAARLARAKAVELELEAV
jgi:asparagine synthase (glutamine-hydrolysing)